MKNLFLWFRDALADFGWELWDAGAWFYNHGLSGVSRYFYNAVDFIDEICGDLWDIAYELDDWYDWISGIWSDLTTVWNYVYGLLTQRAYEAWTGAGNALDQAAAALSKATDAFNYAYGWLTDRANEAWDKAVWAYEQISVIVTAAANDIYNWVKGVPAEIRTWVTNAVNDVKTWALGKIDDAKSSVLAQIAAPINLVNLWFVDIQDFFNDPAEWITGKLDEAVDRLGQQLWDVIERILEKVW
jgi:hypothetical protein